MQIYTATVLNGSAFFNYIEIFTDYYGLMQLGLKIRQHCTNLIDNAHRSELLLASFYFSFPFWASWCYPFGKPVISPEYREGFNKIKHMHATFLHYLKLVTWRIFTLSSVSCKPNPYWLPVLWPGNMWISMTASRAAYCSSAPKILF